MKLTISCVFPLPGTMNFNAKHGCQRCNVVGKHSGISNTVVFTQIKQELREDCIFRANGYPKHQNAYTPLVELPNVDIVRDFVVADPLHLLELGVMKRLITGWRSGNLACPKWDNDEMTELSKKLLHIKTPREINRNARSLHIFKFWKGQEFRNFLIYFSIVVLKDHLAERYYFHFLKLFCAVRLASSDKHLNQNYGLIKLLFDDFVLEFKSIYGPQFMTSNIHNLVHIIEDVQRFGPLHSISAYPFESNLGKMKDIVRTGQNPLKQIAKRMIERCNIEYDKPAAQNAALIAINRPNRSKCSIFIEQRNLMLCNYRFEDQWFLSNGKIMKMINAGESIEYNGFYVEGIALESQTNFFTNPFESSLFNIYLADISVHSYVHTKVKVAQIDCKFFCVQKKHSDHVFIPILHTEKK